MIQGLDHINIVVSNLEEARTFFLNFGFIEQDAAELSRRLDLGHRRSSRVCGPVTWPCTCPARPPTSNSSNTSRRRPAAIPPPAGPIRSVSGIWPLPSTISRWRSRACDGPASPFSARSKPLPEPVKSWCIFTVPMPSSSNWPSIRPDRQQNRLPWDEQQAAGPGRTGQHLASSRPVRAPADAGHLSDPDLPPPHP